MISPLVAPDILLSRSASVADAIVQDILDGSVKAFDFLSCKRVRSPLWMQSCIPEHVLNVDVAYPCNKSLVEQVFLNPSTFSVKHMTEGVYREVIG
jgi:hypothetical protein